MQTILKVVFAFAIIAASILPFFSDTADAKTSYMRAKNKVYYALQNGQPLKEEYIKTNKKGESIYRQTYTKTGDSSTFNMKETKTGLYYYDDKNLSYPIKLNKSWKVRGIKQKVIDDDATIKVKAGTFKHVVVTRDYRSDNTKNNFYYIVEYYAPNVGEILEITHEKIGYYEKHKYHPGTLSVGKEFELTKIKNK